MGLFNRSTQDDLTPNVVSEQTTGGQKFVQGSKKVFKKAVDYDGTEANRIGVPYVGSQDFLSSIFSHPGRKATEYFDALFPFTKWILSYNLQWFIGDLIAGFTVGLVVVPQSLSYANIATLPVEYGLYSSFVGVVIYALFATSKDVTIGPVAVMSLQTANVIRAVQERVPNTYTNPQIASALAFICGVITIGIGLLRIGWIVEFIPAPAVAGFMTGSAWTIAVGQVPKLMGLSMIKTNGPASYEIVIQILKNLHLTTIDAAFGLTSLFFLYFVRWLCNTIPKRYPKYTRACFFISVFRSAFVMIIVTAASYAWLHTIPQKNPAKPSYPISIVRKVPSGFQHMGQPLLTKTLFSDMGGEIPVSVIVLLLEHIAISKSFGRLNNYKINPNQELVAIGVTNLVGPAFGAYSATGSFSRTAIKAKSGVRTPLAGWITAIIVLVALYGLTDAFFWIPNAGLAAVIIHAVGDLMAPLSVSYRFWLVNPLEFIIFFAAVVITVFTTIEIGVYFSVGASLLLLLIRIARPRGEWLGRVRIHYGNSNRQSNDEVSHRDVYVPLDHKDGLRDPSVRVEAPPAGVLIYRFGESFTYPNASYMADSILDHVKSETSPNRALAYKTAGDRPWNDPGPVNPLVVKLVRGATCGLAGRKLHEKYLEDVKAINGTNDEVRPLLRALIFDCSSVSNVDTTSVQTLADIRQAVNRYVGAEVEFHFVGINSPWIRRGLLAAGFGTGQANSHITEVAPVVSQHDIIHQRFDDTPRTELRHRRANNDDPELGQVDTKHADDISPSLPQVPHNGARDDSEGSSSDHDDIKGDDDPTAGAGGDSVVTVPIIWNHDLTPFFHLDMNAAVKAATGNTPW